MSTTTFTTRSGSLYEIDTSLSRIRRVTGPNPPTQRQGTDGEWQDYQAAAIVGGCVWYFPLEIQDPDMPIARGVLTSTVAEGLDSLTLALNV